jgi:hypothetical protein
VYKNYLTDLRNKYQHYDIHLLTQTIADIAGDLDPDNVGDHITELKILVSVLEHKVAERGDV